MIVVMQFLTFVIISTLILSASTLALELALARPRWR